MKYSEEQSRKIIVDHFSKPNNQRSIDKDFKSEFLIEAPSYSCADNFKIVYKVDKDKITDIYFDGQGCAISTSAIDIICDQLKSMTTLNAIRMLESYETMIKDSSDKSYDEEGIKDLVVFRNIHKQQSRVKCALLCSNKIIDKLKT